MADTRLLEAMLPLVAATMSRRRNNPLRGWLDFQAAAPPAVSEYVVAVDNVADHPAVEDALEALSRALQTGAQSPLRHVQGSIVQWSEWRLGWSFAHERAAGKTAATFDDFIGEQAAQALLRWSHRESHAAWLEPERFIDRWRVAGTDDADILARAGLHAAELRLLDAN